MIHNHLACIKLTHLQEIRRLAAIQRAERDEQARRLTERELERGRLSNSPKPPLPSVSSKFYGAAKGG